MLVVVVGVKVIYKAVKLARVKLSVVVGKQEDLVTCVLY